MEPMLSAEAAELLRFFYAERAFQLPQRFAALLSVCLAQGEHEQAAGRVLAALRAAAAIKARDIAQSGLQGERLRAQLDRRRIAAIARLG